MQRADAQDQIEGGAAGQALRLWKAREALRQGELSLKSQSESRDNLRVAATSLLGWSVTAIGVVAAAALTAEKPEWRHAAAVAILGMFFTAILCVAILFPRRWAKTGFAPTQVLDNPLPSELEITEALADGVDRDIRDNRAGLIWTSIVVRVAWSAFVAAPALALAELAGYGEGVSAFLLRVVR